MSGPGDPSESIRESPARSESVRGRARGRNRGRGRGRVGGRGSAVEKRSGEMTTNERLLEAFQSFQSTFDTRLSAMEKTVQSLQGKRKKGAKQGKSEGGEVAQEGIGARESKERTEEQTPSSGVQKRPRVSRSVSTGGEAAAEGGRPEPPAEVKPGWMQNKASGIGWKTPGWLRRPDGPRGKVSYACQFLRTFKPERVYFDVILWQIVQKKEVYKDVMDEQLQATLRRAWKASRIDQRKLEVVLATIEARKKYVWDFTKEEDHWRNEEAHHPGAFSLMHMSL